MSDFKVVKRVLFISRDNRLQATEGPRELEFHDITPGGNQRRVVALTEDEAQVLDGITRRAWF